MAPTIRHTPLTATLFGASARHDPAKHYGQEIIALLDRVWPVIKGRKIANKGINWVVYGDGGREVFAGVEAEVADAATLGLERRDIRVTKYAQWVHVGPYSKLGAACAAFNRAVDEMRLEKTGPLIEMYGHWTEDENKLETTIVLPIA